MTSACGGIPTLIEHQYLYAAAKPTTQSDSRPRDFIHLYQYSAVCPFAVVAAHFVSSNREERRTIEKDSKNHSLGKKKLDALNRQQFQHIPG